MVEETQGERTKHMKKTQAAQRQFCPYAMHPKFFCHCYIGNDLAVSEYCIREKCGSWRCVKYRYSDMVLQHTCR